jgi:DHA2 family multidrug resistance protein
VIGERLTATTAMLVAKGMDASAAGRAAMSLLGRAVAGQSTVIAFDTAFNAVALLFVIAAPLLVTVKIGLHRYAKAQAAKSPRTIEFHLKRSPEQEVEKIPRQAFG